MKNILIVATVSSHIKAFHMPFIKKANESGYLVDTLSNGEIEYPYINTHYNIKLKRSPCNFSNLKSLFKIRNIIKSNNYDVIYCHTPVGSSISRLAVLRLKNKPKVVYMAHGLHFYKGAPLINWLLYFPIEKYLSRYTDLLITINNEDYNNCNKYFKNKNLIIKKINGVGIDLNDFKSNSYKEKIKSRSEMGFKKDDLIIFFAGELNKNKNQMFTIKAVKRLLNENSKIYLLLAGEGDNKEVLEHYIYSNKLEKNIRLLGRINNVAEYLRICDIVVSSSKREGLPVNVIEAMSVGRPLVLSNIRGHRDLIRDNKFDLLFDFNDLNNLEDKLKRLINNDKLRDSIGAYNKKESKKYDTNVINNKLLEIINKCIDN